MDDDRAGIPRVVTLAPLCLSPRAQSDRTFYHRTDVSLCRSGAFSLPGCQTTRAAVGVVDESGNRRDGGRQSFCFGLKAYLLIQLTVTVVGGAIRVWLFYVQHQFDGAYWERGDAWDYTAAALQGSSFYKLPKVLQWFTGNIGFHHIHHLSPRIPNYNLERCHNSHPIFDTVKPLTLLASLKSITLHLWDEQRRAFITNFCGACGNTRRNIPEPRAREAKESPLEGKKMQRITATVGGCRFPRRFACG